ncbi:O-antigen ligase family protein [Nocardioides sp. AE5]|uniref:O-antigen ligase family protein n=1 Tax=Nocardioides sp. AE5 TaxID=2962573 RepID=UPI00288193E8|nr:O-antigen ligase family protein [Nocardioides sp. AE5]MDT0203810.1 O-antigen ligase family protein [Nocardioides sp. AE5]
MAATGNSIRSLPAALSSLRGRPWLIIAVVITLGAVLETVARLDRFLPPVGAGFIALGLAALLLHGLRPHQFRTPIDLAVWASVLAGILAFVINSHGGSRLVAYAVVALFFYLSVGVQRAWQPGRVVVSLGAATAVAITAGWAVIQAVFDIDTGYCRARIEGGADGCFRDDTAIRVTGTFSNPNLLAPVLILLIPVGCVALRMAFGKKWGRILAAGLGLLGASALMLTLSRGGLVSMVVLCLAALALKNPSRRILVGTGLAVAAGIMVAFGTLLAKFSIGPRQDVYRESLELAREHPWGLGLGRSGPFLDQRIPGDQRFFHSHNLWLTWWVETGFLGLFAAFWLTVAITVVIIRGARRRDALVVAAGSGLAGFGVISLFDNPSFDTHVSLALWTVLSIAVSARHRRPPRVPPDGDEPSTLSP